MTGWRTIAALAGMSLSAPLAAQDYTPVPPQLDGEITASDNADTQGRRYDEYAVELNRGNAMMVEAASASGSRIEPVIEIYGAGGGAPLAQDGRSGADSAARLLFTAREAAVYRVRVVAGSPAAGRYSLRLRRGPPSRGSNFATRNVTPPPSSPGPPADNASTPPGPLSRFIICPGHRRCPN